MPRDQRLQGARRVFRKGQRLRRKKRLQRPGLEEDDQGRLRKEERKIQAPQYGDVTKKIRIGRGQMAVSIRINVRSSYEVENYLDIGVLPVIFSCL